MAMRRIFEYTHASVQDRFKSDESVLFDDMLRLPCLFMEEGTGDEIAYVGEIKRAGQSGSDVLIEYNLDSDIKPIPNSTIFENMEKFGIWDKFELHRTHWALKDVDLYRVLLRLSGPQRGSPRVFSIAEREAIEQGLASVMMPFDAAFDPVYEAVRSAAEEVGLNCRRADEIWEKPEVIQDIVNLIDRSFVVVCDCTKRNANVFYEIGIAHTLGREVVLISQADADIPFDLQHLRYVKYLDNDEGRQELKVALSKRFRYLQENL